MSPTTPNDPWSRRRSAGTRQISVCQPRLALSASPGADVLMEMLGVAGANPGNTLWQQADDLHSQHGLTGDGQTIAVIDSGLHMTTSRWAVVSGLVIAS